MTDDIRDKSHINHNDIVELNFIKKPGVYVFRKYFKQGLRSQIMEVLDPFDVQKQEKGDIIDGIRQFPWAKPLKMLRIFRTKFHSLKEVFEEIKKYKIVENYLPEDSYAKSCEFIVEYVYGGKRDVVLCGLQDYVEGEVLNPWELIHTRNLKDMFSGINDQERHPIGMTADKLIHRVREKAEDLIDGLKRMILEVRYVPDLAGIGNLILTSSGGIKLVDINNISKVSFGPGIKLDDKGYPICDKSIEAISILEQKILDRTIDETGPLYKLFLAPERMEKVKDLEEKFHTSIKNGGLSPW